ncbi:hypothetical protein C8J29_11283 [Cereibacter johrii]|uniref:Uncharacterized protein n=1 Tax=Cereibacter johrii TaxID=445629 RepID=A0ABX5J5F0_9RHOB|nr:hypothetical protein C8J29_11283 [Cereibacter johrii]
MAVRSVVDAPEVRDHAAARLAGFVTVGLHDLEVTSAAIFGDANEHPYGMAALRLLRMNF